MRSSSSSRSDRHRRRGDRHRGTENPEMRQSHRRHFDRSPADRRRNNNRYFEERGDHFLNSRSKKPRRSPMRDAPEKSKKFTFNKFMIESVLYVGNLPFKVTEEMLCEIFSLYGTITSCDLV
jgi:RNA recognition motif-containing protein